MLQRFVRSTVNTDPRPYRTFEEPTLCSPSSLWAGMSRPGNWLSIHFKNDESTAIKSSKWPCCGQSFTIQTCPSRSTICALISPTFSCIRSRQSFSPPIIAARASFTHCGHRESVCRGKPSVGLVFSHDFSSGLSDHSGFGDGLGFFLLKYWMVSKVIPAVLQTTQSIDRKICVEKELGILRLPRFREFVLYFRIS